MSRKKRFIKDLTEENIKELEHNRKHGKGYQFRDRCQCVIFSFFGYEIQDLCLLFSVTRQTISTWFDDWEKGGIEGLKNKSGQGRKPKLSINNDEHGKIIETAAKNAAETGTNMLNEVTEKLNLEEGLSQSTLRRFLKKKVCLEETS